MGDILAVLGTALGTLGTMIGIAYHMEKKNEGIGGLTCTILSVTFLVLWLIVFTSIYLLIGHCLELFGLSRAPYLVRVFWPEALLPYAPFVLTFYSWVETTILLFYFVRHDGETDEERADRFRWHVGQMRKFHNRFWIALFVVWVLVQVYYRTTWLSWIPVPAPL